MRSLPNNLSNIDLETYFQSQGYMAGRPVQLYLLTETNEILFLCQTPPQQDLRLYRYDVSTKQTSLLVCKDDLMTGQEEILSVEEKAKRERLRLQAKGLSSFSVSPDQKTVLLPFSGRMFFFSLETGRITEWESSEGPILNPTFCPQGSLIAYVKNKHLFVLDRTSQKETQLTHGNDPHTSYGLAEFIAQEEMGRFSGFSISPDSSSIAVCEVCEQTVETFHITDPANPQNPPQVFPYPRPGKHNAVLRVGMIPIGGGKITWVTWDADNFPYVATLRWQSADTLTLVVQTRDQKRLKLLSVSKSTGVSSVLLEETDPAWLNLDQTVPFFLPGHAGFLWSSEREGTKTLEWRSPQGALVKTLCPKTLGYQQFLSMQDKDHIVVAASIDPIQRHLYRISLTDGNIQPLTHELGVHQGIFGMNKNLWLHTEATPLSMPKTWVKTLQGHILAELPSHASEPPMVPKVEYTTVSDHRFHAAIVRPSSFQAGQTYPVIVDVYAGPGHKQVIASQRRFLLNQWLADQGFVVVTIDGRGTPDRGRDWERAILGSFSHIPLQDQKTAIQELLQTYPELDKHRVGIHGWSFGGYMAALAVMKHPDVFHAAVAGAPVVDWRDYDTHYTERYLGLPDQNQKGYDQSSLLSYAENVSRPLLLMHGTADDNVYFFHTLKLAQALFENGKNFQMIPMIGITHMISDPTLSQRRWEKIADFFRSNLLHKAPL